MSVHNRRMPCYAAAPLTTSLHPQHVHQPCTLTCRQNLKLWKRDLKTPGPEAWWLSRPVSCAAPVVWRRKARGLPPSDAAPSPAGWCHTCSAVEGGEWRCPQWSPRRTAAPSRSSQRLARAFPAEGRRGWASSTLRPATHPSRAQGRGCKNFRIQNQDSVMWLEMIVLDRNIVLLPWKGSGWITSLSAVPCRCWWRLEAGPCRWSIWIPVPFGECHLCPSGAEEWDQHIIIERLCNLDEREKTTFSVCLFDFVYVIIQQNYCCSRKSTCCWNMPRALCLFVSIAAQRKTALATLDGNISIA